MKAAIYARVSTADQTLGGQVAELTAYCQARGWEPVVYQDVQSGACTSRSGLEALMAAVRRREVGAVVVVKLDRLGRSLSHFAAILHELQALGVGLVCITQGIDTVHEAGRMNPAAHFFVTVLAAVAEFERELIRERTIDGLKAARARGAKIGRPLKMTPARREEILLLHQQGCSLRSIGRTVRLSAATVCGFLRSAAEAGKGAA